MRREAKGKRIIERAVRCEAAAGNSHPTPHTSPPFLSVAVVGLGWWGPKLLRNFKSHPAVKSVVGVDMCQDVCRQVHEALQVAVTTDPLEIIRRGELDAVVVATPPQAHYEIAREALLAGCHVLLTKPPTKTVAELRELISLAEPNRLVLMMDSTFVYSSHVRKLKELLGNGLLKDVRFVQSLRFGNDMHMHHVSRIRNTMFANGLDVIEDLYFHDAAMLTYLFDGTFTPVSVERHHILHPELCDTAFIQLQSESFTVQVGLSWTLPQRKRELLIYSPEGYLKLDDLAEEPKITHFELESKELKAFTVEAREPLFNVVDHFLECIRSGSRPITDGQYMLALTQNVEAVKNFSRSAR